MSPTSKRLCTVAGAGGAALVLLAGPAGASTGTAMTSSAVGGARAAAGASTAADVQGAGPDTSGVAAASVGFKISGASCFANDVAFDADTYETGFSGVQRFRQTAQLQKFTTRGWVNATGVATALSQKFPNDGRSFHFARSWDGNHANNGGSWRVKWQGTYLNGGGGAVARTKVILITCR